MKPRVAWRNALWEADLSTKAKIVGLAYEKHAGQGIDAVWVSGDTLRRITGLSRDTANKALRELEACGWLLMVEPARQHRSTRYRLTIPRQPSEDRNPETERVVTGDTPPRASVPIYGVQRSDLDGPAFRQSEANSNQNSDQEQAFRPNAHVTTRSAPDLDPWTWGQCQS